MKKQLLTLITIAITSLSFAQNSKQIKKAPSKINSSPKTAVDPEASTRNNAQKWFKESYVEKLFKDPYSYKLLKLTSEKVNVKQSLIDSISYLDGEMAKCNIAEKDATPQNRALWQSGYDKSFSDLQIQQEKLKNNTDADQVELLNRLIAIHKKYSLKYLSGLKDFDIYFLSKNEKERIQAKILSITPEQGLSLAFYRINLDCYSKNAIGNDILGRFQFPFTEKGVIGSGDGFDTVIQLNKPD